MELTGKLISKDSSSREVHDLLNGTVLKKPKNERGELECYNEQFIFEHSPDWVKSDLCPVIEYNMQEDYIVMKKIKAFTLKNDITDILKEKAKTIDYLVKNYDLDEFDLSFAFNWGIDENGRVLLLDYGHTFCDDYVD